MRSDDQRWYNLERARTSLEMATAARDPAIATIHLELYERYMEKAGEMPAPQPRLRVVR